MKEAYNIPLAAPRSNDRPNMPQSTGSDLHTYEETLQQYSVYERLYSLHMEKLKEPVQPKSTVSVKQIEACSRLYQESLDRNLRF
jgi:hypothetical protein